MNKYQIFTDATADLNEELMKGLPEVKIIPMEIRIDQTPYIYGPGGNIDQRFRRTDAPDHFHRMAFDAGCGIFIKQLTELFRSLLPLSQQEQAAPHPE